MENQTRKKLTYIIIVTGLFFGGYFLYDHFKPAPASFPSLGCEEHYRRFERIFRDIRLRQAVYPGQPEEVIFEGLAKPWDAFYALRKNADCELRPPDKDAEKAIYLLNDYIQKTNEFYLEKDLPAAAANFNKAASSLRQYKQNNNIFYVDDILLEMYPSLIKVNIATGKKEAGMYLEDLKFKFTGLKQYNEISEFTALVSQMEQNIAALDRLLWGLEYIAAKEKILDLFLEMYYGY